MPRSPLHLPSLAIMLGAPEPPTHRSNSHAWCLPLKLSATARLSAPLPRFRPRSFLGQVSLGGGRGRGVGVEADESCWTKKTLRKKTKKTFQGRA